MSSITSTFAAFLSKQPELDAIAAAKTKITAAFSAINKAVKDSGYEDLEALFADAQALTDGKPLPSLQKGKRGPKAAKTPKAPGKKKGPAKGTRVRYTDEDRAHWREVYEGPANRNMSEARRILAKEGKPVSGVTISNEAKKWPKPAVS
jgi:hypothetical protein